MASQIEPLIVYRYHDGAISPNPWKVSIILRELSLPFDMRSLDRSDPEIRTKEPLGSITPNGRMPALHDPNTGIKLWESGAIIEYLLDVYDKENTLSYTTSPEKYEQNCWKHFQMSGQGPYFGQLNWFLYLHAEPIPSAQSRYATELRRILGVIDAHLARTSRPYLVGQKISYADLMFVPWNWQALKISMGPNFGKEWAETWPHSWAWSERCMARESCREAEAEALRAWNSVEGGPPIEIQSHSATLGALGS